MKRNFKTTIALGAVALVLAISLFHLFASQLNLKLAPNPTSPGKQVTFKLQVQSGSNSVIYLLQSSTNLANWQTVLSGKATPGSTVQIGNVNPTEKARFF